MTTLYKIDGEYVSWTEANRMGYTTSPSNPVSYKSADPQTWGQTEGNGLMQGDLSDPMSGSYFVEGEPGWVNIENLSLVQKLYPSTAEDVVMHNTNTGNDSAGVKIESNGDYYYLISGDLSHGWIVESDLDEFDWEEKGAATLPTVTPYRKSVQYTGYQINAGDSQFLVDSGTKISYDSSVIYGFRQWVKFSSVQRTPGEIINDGGFIAAKNTGSSAVTGVYTVDYATCSSNQAELVTVLNSSDEAYNAFKFTVDNTDYYYVLDGVQTDWTDNLSSIGYHLPLPLPTVEIFADSASGWCCTSSFPNTTNISSNYIVELYNRDGGGTVTGRSSCDTSKKYSLIQWQAVQGIVKGRTEIEIESDTGYLRAKNVSNSAITFLQARIVVCSSSDATVEMVLDADNNRYNAFKYTLNGTDYYYVLDGVQTDWTSDLSSIGYHLRPEFVFALQWRDGDWVSVNFDYGANDNYWYAGILTAENASLLDSLGFSRTTGTNYGNYGYLNSNSRSKFEVLEVYEDLGQNPVSGYDLSTLEFRMSNTVLTLWNTVRNATNLKSYLCRVTPPEPLVIIFCVRWDGSSWIAPSFTDNDWFYTGIRNNDDKYAIQGIGLSVTTRAANAGPYGNILYDSNYNYEILELYSDIGQTVSSYTNLSNLSMGSTTYNNEHLLTIQNVTAINAGLIRSYRLRITKKQS